MRRPQKVAEDFRCVIRAEARRSPGSGGRGFRAGRDRCACPLLNTADAGQQPYCPGGRKKARCQGRAGGRGGPLVLKTDANPGCLPIEAFDKIRAGVAADCSQFLKDLTTPFYGANRPDAKISQGVRRGILVPRHAGRSQE